MEITFTFRDSRGMHELTTATGHMSHMGCFRVGEQIRTSSVDLLEGKEREVHVGRQPHNISWLAFHVTCRETTFSPNVYITFNSIDMSYFNIYHHPVSGNLSCSNFLLLQTILPSRTFLNIYLCFCEIYRSKNARSECMNILDFNIFCYTFLKNVIPVVSSNSKNNLELLGNTRARESGIMTAAMS